jgi:hypothetical protein
MFRRTFMFLLVAFSCGTAFAQLQVSNNPTGAAVVITQPSAVLVTWSVQSGEANPTTVVSDEGLFVLGSEVLGQVKTSLTASVSPNGTAAVNETLLIPPDVSNRALKRNAPTFFYKRTFRSTSSGATGQSSLTCRLSTSAYGNFSIAAVTIFFENQRGEATFLQNDPRARASVEVRYNGTGLLKAAWEVQEPNSSQFRVLQQVNYHLTYGDRIVFFTPSVPPIPTLLTGRHLLRFRIDQPVSGFELPQVTYFVRAPAGSNDELKISLATPLQNAHIDEKTGFVWNGKATGTLLRFNVFERGSFNSILSTTASTEPLSNSQELSGSKTIQNPDIFLVKGVEVFSASLPPTTTRYDLKPDQWKRLKPATWYVWQLQSLDEAGKVVSETELRAFQIESKKKD